MCHYGGMQRTREEVFSEEVERLSGDEYLVVGSESVNGRICFHLWHRACNTTYLTCKQNFFIHRRCPKCWVHPRRKTTEEFKAEVLRLVGGEYVVLGDYTGNKIPVEMLHATGCGRSFVIRPQSFYAGARCARCFGHQRDFAKEMFNLVGEEYSLLEFTSYTKYAVVIHNKGGHKYRIPPSQFLCGYRCPKCRESKGERKISNYLDEKGLMYKSQFRLTGCKHKRSLPFDFAVFDDTGKIRFLIEFDGRHHYCDDVPNREPLALVKKKDAIKDAYCKGKGIKLIRIPYTRMSKVNAILDLELGGECEV